MRRVSHENSRLFGTSGHDYSSRSCTLSPAGDGEFRGPAHETEQTPPAKPSAPEKRHNIHPPGSSTQA